MKKIYFILIAALLLLGCEGNDTSNKGTLSLEDGGFVLRRGN